MLLVLAFIRPLIGHLGRQKGFFGPQDSFQPREVDFSIDIPQVAENFQERPFSRERAIDPLFSQEGTRELMNQRRGGL